MAKLTKIEELTELAREHLDADEEIVAVVYGDLKQRMQMGILIATDKRVVSYYRGLSRYYELEVFPYSKITSIEVTGGGYGHDVSLFVYNNKISMTAIFTEHTGCFAKFLYWGSAIVQESKDVQGFVEYVKSKIAKTDEEDTPPKPTMDVLDQIRKLAELKNQGILTEDEFELKKTELLGKF